MNSIILYSSNIAATNTQTIFAGKEKIPIFIRAEMCRNMDALEALQKAKPRDGETVLNTIEITIPVHIR